MDPGDADEPSREALESRVAELEQTVSKMLPDRRGVLKGLGAAAIGGAAVGASSGGASGQSAAGQVGTESEPVDVEANDLDVQGALQRDLDAGGQAITNAGSVSTNQQFINSNQLYLQDTEPADLTDAAWINTDPLPASNVLTTLTTDQTIPASSSPSEVDFDAIVRDVNNEFDLGNKGFTPIEAGLYQVSGQVRYDGGGTGDSIGSFIYIDGNLSRRKETFRPEIGETVVRSGTLSFPPITVELDAGQTLSARFRNEDSECTLVGNAEFSYLSISRVD